MHARYRFHFHWKKFRRFKHHYTTEIKQTGKNSFTITLQFIDPNSHPPDIYMNKMENSPKTVGEHWRTEHHIFREYTVLGERVRIIHTDFEACPDLYDEAALETIEQRKLPEFDDLNAEPIECFDTGEFEESPDLELYLARQAECAEILHQAEEDLVEASVTDCTIRAQALAEYLDILLALEKDYDEEWPDYVRNLHAQWV